MPSGELIRFTLDLGKAFIGLAVPLCVGMFAVAVGFANRSSHAMPRWLGISGIIVGIVELVGGVFFLPLVLFPIWIAAVSFALLAKPAR